MNDNKVISLAERKKQNETAEEQAVEQARKDSIEAYLVWIDKIREQIAKGNFVAPIMIAYSPPSGMFFSDFITPSEGLSTALAHSYVAQLELMKLTMAEIAVEMPILCADGTPMEMVKEEE